VRSLAIRDGFTFQATLHDADDVLLPRPPLIPVRLSQLAGEGTLIDNLGTLEWIAGSCSSITVRARDLNRQRGAGEASLAVSSLSLPTSAMQDLRLTPSFDDSFLANSLLPQPPTKSEVGLHPLMSTQRVRSGKHETSRLKPDFRGRLNRNLIFNLVRTKQPVSRADLSRLNGPAAQHDLADRRRADQGWGGLFEGSIGKLPRGRNPTFSGTQPQPRDSCGRYPSHAKRLSRLQTSKARSSRSKF